MAEPEVCSDLSSKAKDQDVNLSKLLGEKVESAEKAMEVKTEEEEDEKQRKENQLSVEECPAKMEVDPTDSPPEEQGTTCVQISQALHAKKKCGNDRETK